MPDSRFFRNVCLSDALLRVRALPPALAFYRDLLGLRIIMSSARRTEFSANGHRPALLVLEEHPKDEDRAPGSPGLFHLAFLFPDREAIATATSRLVSRNYPLQGASDHGVSEAIYLADPEGNGLELYADRPAKVWPQNGAFVKMFTRRLDLQELLSRAVPTRDDYSIPPETRLGHMHLNVVSLEQTESLLRNKLRIDVRQRDVPGALFFGYDGYHHHLAANTWDVRSGARQGVVGLESFTVRITPELASGVSEVILDGMNLRVSPLG
jgi:catechol 2,3-dioxygenase